MSDQPAARNTASDATTRTSSAVPHNLPLLIRPYRLVERIGESAMGEVWRAEQKSPGVDPSVMGTGPVRAVRKAQTSWTQDRANRSVGIE